MRAINHTVSGALIGTVVSNPGIALPAALLSHFIMDSIPHSGGSSHTSTFFKFELIIDATLSAVFLVLIALLQPEEWTLLIACAVLAASPDLWWLPYWLQELKGKKKKLDPLGRIFSKIQWSETRAGYVIEAVWLIATLGIFLRNAF